MNARNIDGSTPLCDACAAGNLECVKLLLEYGAMVNPPLFTFSPLHEACMGGKKACFVSRFSFRQVTQGLQKQIMDRECNNIMTCGHVRRIHFSCLK